MTPSPLQLDTYFIAEMRWAAQIGFEATPESSGTISPNDLEVGVRPFEVEGRDGVRAVELSIELSDSTKSRFPYVFRVVLVGFFLIRDDYPAEHAEVMFAANAPALLYSAAREALATATGRGPYTDVCLPAVTFVRPSPKPKPAASARVAKDVAPVARKATGSKVSREPASAAKSESKTERGTTRRKPSASSGEKELA